MKAMVRKNAQDDQQRKVASRVFDSLIFRERRKPETAQVKAMNMTNFN